MTQACIAASAAQYLETYRKIFCTMRQDITQAALPDSISGRFIVQMIPHHRGAIQMAENLLRFTRNETLSAIAEHIIVSQTESIAMMEQILPACIAWKNRSCLADSYQKRTDQILCVMFSEMEHAPESGNVDCDFLQEMIPHHLGGVRMSQNALRRLICPELKPILEAIITSQEKGICQMKQLLRQLDCGTLQ